MASSKRVTRWYSECGKGYWKRVDAEHHETVCKCWTNPKNRFFECSSPYVDDIHSGGPKGVDYISVKCAHWDAK